MYGRLSVGKGYLSISQLLVGAALYPAQLGSPDPAVSTGFVHQLLFALSNLVGDPRALSCSMR